MSRREFVGARRREQAVVWWVVRSTASRLNTRVDRVRREFDVR